MHGVPSAVRDPLGGTKGSDAIFFFFFGSCVVCSACKGVLVRANRVAGAGLTFGAAHIRTPKPNRQRNVTRENVTLTDY